MFIFMPTEYMRRIFEKNNFELTDFNKATLIWNMPRKSRDERLNALKEFADTISDNILKQQIYERINYENNVVETFKTNSAKQYVYVVEDEQKYSRGFFTKYDMAYAYGLRYTNKYEDNTFTITKQKIIINESDLIVENGIKANWHILSDKEIDEYTDYKGHAVAEITFTSEGEIQRVWSSEMPDTENERIDGYNSERFEYQFIKVPFEGRLGMSVRDITDGTYGVLMQDTEGWNHYLKVIDEKNMFVDFSDIQVEVVYLTEQGVWSHDHVNPLYLEEQTAPCKNNDKKCMAWKKATDSFIEYWSKKQEESADINMYADRAIQYARQYRDICLEIEFENKKRKCQIADKAKHVEELIL